MKKPRKRRYWDDYITSDPGDGLEINRSNDARMVSKRSTRYSIFDADNIAVELEVSKGRRSFKKVSVLGEVRKVNASKTKNLNKYKDRMNNRRGF
jgi:hypothetical protein